MHGNDPADRVWACPNPSCPLVWSSREDAEDCCDD